MVSLTSENEGREAVVLRCCLSDARVESCGFIYSAEGAEHRVECTLEEKSFDARLTGLVQGVVYSWCAYYSAGGTELRSEQGVFRLTADTDPIPVEDPAFKAWLVSNFDTDGNGQISYAEAERITQIFIWKSEEYNIQSLQGIEFMPRLTHLCCVGSWKDPLYEDLPEHYYIGRRAIEGNHTSGAIGTLKRADVSHNPKLVYLNLSHNEGLGETVGEIDLSNNPMLKEVELAFSSLKFPKISHLANLKRFVTKGCYGEAPDFSVFSTLEHLEISDPLEDFDFDVDVSNCRNIETLIVSNTKGAVSGIAGNNKLKRLEIRNWKGLTLGSANLEQLKSAIPNLTDLERLDLESMKIGNIDFSRLKHLRFLEVSGNEMTQLDVSSNVQLEYLNCNWNNLSELNLSGLSSLREIYCDGNPLTSLDVSGNVNLQELFINGDGFSSIDLSHNAKLEELGCRGNMMTALDVSHNPLLKSLSCVQQNRSDGTNYLKTLYISEGQSIPYVTVNRDIDHIPEETEIVELSLYSLGEIIESGSTGIVAAVTDSGREVLLMSVDEIHNRPWQESWNWCEGHGAGWRMPTIDELTAIQPIFYYLNDKLRAAGYTPLTEENKCYWSCTPYEIAGFYYRERLWDGGIWYYGFDEWHECYANYTRAVKTISL